MSARVYSVGSHLATIRRRDNRFFITRDSSPDGTLSESIDIWTSRPVRHRIAAEGGYVWVPAGVSAWFSARSVRIDVCMRMFGTVIAGDGVCMLLERIKP